MSRPAVWYLFVVIFSSTAVAQPASAAGQRETRGDPKTTYNQSENEAHSNKGALSSGAVSTSSQANMSTQVSTSTTNQTDAAGHWLVRRVTTSSGSQWTLYDSGEIKQVGSP